MRKFALFATVFAGGLVGCALPVWPTHVQTQVTAANIVDGWEVERIDDRVPKQRAASIIFRPGGRMDGSITCNTFSGTYRIVGGQVQFGDAVMTLLGCDGFDPRLQKVNQTVFGPTSISSLSADLRRLTFRSGRSSVTFHRITSR